MKRTATLVATVLCLAALVPLSGRAATTSVGEVLPFEAVASDGTPLRGHVYLPTTPGPHATILEYSPYWGTNFPRSTQLAETDDNDHTTLWRHLGSFIDAGFAVAAINIRGTDQSGGCLQWGTEIDATDGALVVETLAAQPWSNGKVGMIGHSFPGWMTYLAMTVAPPSLGAVAVASGIIDPWNLMTRNGAAFSLGPPAMPAATAGTGLALLRWQSDFPGAVGTTLETPPGHVTCPRYLDDTFASVEMLPSGDRNAYWDSVDIRERLRDTDIPTLVTNGLRQEGHMLQVEGLWDLLGEPRRMTLGQWNHQWPHTAGHESWLDTMVGWFDHYLRGGPMTVPPEVVDFQDSSERWHTASSWPPKAGTYQLHLSASSLVPDGEAVEELAQTFQSMDYDPVPASCVHRQAVYVSDPFETDVVIAGNFQLDLELASTLPDGNIAAILFHKDDIDTCADPEPPPANPIDGYLFAPFEARRALVDLRHVNHQGYGADFPVNATTDVSLTSHPLATHVKEGERLILAVGGGARELFPETRKPALTVSGGTLTLPIFVGEAAVDTSAPKTPAQEELDEKVRERAAAQPAGGSSQPAAAPRENDTASSAPVDDTLVEAAPSTEETRSGTGSWWLTALILPAAGGVWLVRRRRSVDPA